MSKTFDEVKAEHEVAVQREVEASRCWKTLAVAAREANEKANKAFMTWNAAADARNAAFEEVYAATKPATVPALGDA